MIQVNDTEIINIIILSTMEPYYYDLKFFIKYVESSRVYVMTFL